jgi:hypothetical protein
MIGSTRETVSVVISQLKKEGLLKKTPFHLKIEAEKTLEELNRKT